MAKKYWRLSFKGEREAQDIQSKVGENGGTLLRLHFHGGETRAYFAAEELAVEGRGIAQMTIDGATPTEVSADEVTRLD